MADVATSVASAFDHVWDRFLGRLGGLGDEEYFWEPAEGCWSVRRADDGRWRIDGDGGDASAGPAPDPAPVTTIAWRIGHIGLTFIGFGDRLFADGKITLADVEFAPSAAAARAFLDRTYHAYWRDRIGTLSQQQWWSPIGASFGPYKDLCTTDLTLHVLDERIHHAAEIGVLRDLYRQRGVVFPYGAGAPRPTLLPEA
jgi:DinB superfamily